MARLPAAVGTVRTAVRRQLADLPRGATVLVACSGGPDSMALAAACAFWGPRLELRAGLVTVDHGLQSGSAERAGTVTVWARTAGLDPVETATVTVDRRRGGPEAAARAARYAALDDAATRHDATVLLGHTMDDQAETVLLALARGSGPRGIAGMPAKRGHRWRPLLDVSRADTWQTCQDLGLPIWHDPHNTDPAYTRSRLRAALPLLTDTLGDRLVANLARTARLIAADTAALDGYATDLLHRAREADRTLRIGPPSEAPEAVRTRVWRHWLLDAGADPDALGFVHIAAVDALVTDWHGQGPAAVPGGLSVHRAGDRLVITRSSPND